MAREVVALLQVAGDGIPRVLDHNMDEVEDTQVSLYFVADWVEGRTLTQVIGGRPQPLNEQRSGKGLETRELLT
jgi:hypothetical protein